MRYMMLALLMGASLTAHAGLPPAVQAFDDKGMLLAESFSSSLSACVKGTDWESDKLSGACNTAMADYAQAQLLMLDESSMAALNAALVDACKAEGFDNCDQPYPIVRDRPWVELLMDTISRYATQRLTLQNGSESAQSLLEQLDDLAEQSLRAVGMAQ